MAMESPYYAVVSAGAAQTLEVRVREVAVDSLEGLYFTTVRGSLRLPGAPGNVEVSGKAGHADRARSLGRALRDFAREAEGFLRPANAFKG